MKVRLVRYAVCLATLIAVVAPVAADWRGRLTDGSMVELDPRTHRVWQLGEAGPRPLWDGVHRLEDGSVLIVRDGILVPRKGMLDAWSQVGRADDRSVARDCVRLVERMCGKDSRCGRSESCRLARQLASMAAEADTPESADAIAGQCREAMVNDFFEPCD